MDEEALSEAVQCYPVLYDKSMKEFKDQKLKENAWKKVAESVAGITSGRRSAISSPKRLIFIVIAIVIAIHPGLNSVMKLSERVKETLPLRLQLVRSTKGCLNYNFSVYIEYQCFNQNSNGIIYSSLS